MADVLIKNMEMPKEGSVVIEIYSDGVWCDYKKNSQHAKAIELPPHGRLIDADELQDILRLVLSLVISNELTEKEISLVHRTIGAISEAINDLDTVLEANPNSEGEEKI